MESLGRVQKPKKIPKDVFEENVVKTCRQRAVCLGHYLGEDVMHVWRQTDGAMYGERPTPGPLSRLAASVTIGAALVCIAQVFHIIILVGPAGS